MRVLKLTVAYDGARFVGWQRQAEGESIQGLLEQVLDTVIMSGMVHVYVSQAHKGELVMGAGTDSYNSYAQRGGFHVIEHQLAAAVE